MRAGELRYPATIQQATIVDDSYGSGTKTWSTFALTRIAVYPQKSEEIVVDGKLELITRFIVRMRYISGVLPEMRVLKNDDSRVFEILGIKNKDEANRTIDLICKEYA